MCAVVEFMFGVPLLTTFTVVSLVLILGLIWSDWSDRRKERKILELVRRSREERLPDAAAPAPASTAGTAGNSSWLSRGARRRLYWPALAGVAAAVSLVLARQTPSPVHARSPADARPQTAVDSTGQQVINPDAVSLWFNDFDAPNVGPGDFGSSAGIWTNRTPKQASTRITLSEPLKPVADSPPQIDGSWQRVVNFQSSGLLMSGERRLESISLP